MTVIANSLRYATLTLAVALQCTPAMAEAAGDVARQNTVSSQQAAVQWMSGGIGDEARDEMRKAGEAYSVHMVFSDPQGAYKASIPFDVSQANGRKLYSGVSSGPLLYLKLLPGVYKISVNFDGIWHSKQITAGTPADPARISFVGTGKK